MVRTNLNSSLIIVIILLIVTLSAGLHYHLKAERTKLENQFRKLDAFDEGVRGKIEFLQKLQKELLINVTEFHETIATYQNSQLKLKADNNLLNVDIKKLNKNVAHVENEHYQKLAENSEQIISLQENLYSLQLEQDANLSVLNGKLSTLENMLDQNETEFTDFISKFGTRKMKKNLPTIETENPDLTKN